MINDTKHTSMNHLPIVFSVTFLKIPGDIRVSFIPFFLTVSFFLPSGFPLHCLSFWQSFFLVSSRVLFSFLLLFFFISFSMSSTGISFIFISQKTYFTCQIYILSVVDLTDNFNTSFFFHAIFLFLLFSRYFSFFL